MFRGDYGEDTPRITESWATWIAQDEKRADPAIKDAKCVAGGLDRALEWALA